MIRIKITCNISWWEIRGDSGASLRLAAANKVGRRKGGLRSFVNWATGGRRFVACFPTWAGRSVVVFGGTSPHQILSTIQLYDTSAVGQWIGCW